MSAKYLDISAHLHKCRNRVYRVGVELEGGWTRLPRGVSGLQHDGSVIFEDQIDPQTGINRFKKGELPSPPLIPDGPGNDSKLTLEKWMRSHYPDRVNATCGMHVHQSFSNAFQYQSLMREDYMWTVLEFVKRWTDKAVALNKLPNDHCLFDRLAGKSEYCQHQFFADGQAQRTRKDHDRQGKDHRYTVIHYAFSRIGTVECRLLPMMPTVDIALESIRELLAITSAFMVTIAKEEKIYLDGRQAGKGEPESEASWIAETDLAESISMSVSV